MGPYLSCKLPSTETHMGQNFINVEREVRCSVAKGMQMGKFIINVPT